jgi:uncharacterized tellurite resistance protein B-like protein|tara:strand:+ start:6035 stop:6457 length:423 start_codon:yes stop_codon:yes gene_type:complete
MFNIFNKKETEKENNISLIAVASLLIHSAKIDENFTDKEKKIIQNALIEMGANNDNLIEIMKEAETKEKDSNQILDFTRQIKNIEEEDKKIIIEALWNIIYSDENADMYETNLMRRLSGLLYLDNKTVGDIKEKVRIKKS